MNNFKYIQKKTSSNTFHWFYFTLLLIGTLSITSCDKQIAELQREITRNDLNIERVYEVEILYSDSAIVRMRIQAPLLLNYIEVGKERKEFPEGLKVDFFNERGQVTSTLTAEYAIQNGRDNKITIRKNVKVESVNKEQLETEELIWDETQKKLYTDKWVKVSTTDETIYGYGFTSNQEFTEWVINKVTGRFIVENIRDEF